MTGDFFQRYLHRLNTHVGRKILLLIDNAPSHIWKNTDYSNLEIIALPPNTTSKLQPLDAGIIAAFKCQIRQQQLAYALDILDKEVNSNPYKIDQLTAMRWSQIAWSNMKATVIQNCWKHTGLLSETNSEDIENEIELRADDSIREDYARFITQAGIRDAMTIDNFLNLVEEEELLQEIEMIDDEEWILQSTETVQVDEEQEAAEVDIVPLHSELSSREELQISAKAIAMYERREHPLFETNTIVGALRSVQ